MWNPFKIKELPEVEVPYQPNLSSLNELGVISMVEKFKGEVEQKKIRFPAELGEEHPFDFLQLENLYKKFGFFAAVVDKYIDFIVGPGFFIESTDERAKTIIEDFMRDVNFDTLLRQWIKEALIKGNGFMEIGGDKNDSVNGLKVLNATHMYVERDEFGKIKGFNQYTGNFKGFNMDRLKKEKKIIPFKNKQMAHIPFNIVGDCAYGLGIGYTALTLIDNLLRMNRDQHYLMERKANSPLHAKLGKVDGNMKIVPKETDVTAFGKKMEIMGKKSNWATDDLVDLKVVDFGKTGDKFTSILEFDLNMLLYAFQIPGVIMGMSNINQGIAKVELESFQRRIQSIQAEVEKVIENKIFKRVLRANGFEKDAKGTDVHVEFEWGSPSVLQIEGRMEMMSELITSPITSPAMRMILEDELINLFKLDDDEWEKLKLEQEAKIEEERKRLEKQPQPIVPGQNKNFPKPVVPKLQQPKQPKPEAFIDKFIEILDKKEKERLVTISKIEEERRKELIKQQEDLKKDIEDNSKQTLTKIDSYKKELEKEIEARKKMMEQKLAKKKLIRKGLLSIKKNKAQGLLPAFRITRKTEAYKEPKPLKIKRTKENKNYEPEKVCSHCTEAMSDVNDISEWLGFNYKKYLSFIEKEVAKYDFNLIKAVNEIELNAGMFTESQVEKLRKVLDDGFKKGQGLKDMAKEVDKKVKPKDLYRMTSEGDIKLGASGLPILARSADKRSIGIVRSEVTRMANAGAVEFYKENDIKQVSWIASFGARTCPECESLDGQIFEINNHPGIPLHPMCRCTLSPVVELK